MSLKISPKSTLPNKMGTVCEGIGGCLNNPEFETVPCVTLSAQIADVVHKLYTYLNSNFQTFEIVFECNLSSSFSQRPNYGLQLPLRLEKTWENKFIPFENPAVLFLQFADQIKNGSVWKCMAGSECGKLDAKLSTMKTVNVIIKLVGSKLKPKSAITPPASALNQPASALNHETPSTSAGRPQKSSALVKRKREEDEERSLSTQQKRKKVS